LRRPVPVRPSPEELVRWFGENLKDARERAGLRQVDVAEATGIPQTDVSQMERGIRNCTLQTIARLATAIDVDPQKLLRQPRAKRTKRKAR
jgi:transcriptional regulator with XRE-family HTH domain